MEEDIRDAIGRLSRLLDPKIAPRRPDCSPTILYGSWLEQLQTAGDVFPVYWGAEQSLQEAVAHCHRLLEASGIDDLAAILVALNLPDTAGYLNLSEPLLPQLPVCHEKRALRRADSSAGRQEVFRLSAALVADINRRTEEPDPACRAITADSLIRQALLSPAAREARRSELMHGLRSSSRAGATFLIGTAEASLIAGIKLARLFNNDSKLKIVLIEDKPKGDLASGRKLNEELTTLSTIFPFIEFYCIQSEFEEVYDELRDAEAGGKMSAHIQVELMGDSGPAALKIPLGAADLILLDLQLERKADRGTANAKRPLSGKDLLPLLTNVLPQVPVFVLTKSQDYEDVRECIASGADNYIQKDDVQSVPAAYCGFLTRLGPLVLHLTGSPALRAALIGNLRYWSFKKDLLWFGDKCYHMIGHSFQHISNVWRNANAILAPILDHFPKLMPRDEDLFVFCMSIWLHDVGHKGNDRYGEAFQIRDVHGIISGELVLDSPNNYGIFTDAERQKRQASPYHGRSFGIPGTAMEQMSQRITGLVDALNAQQWPDELPVSQPDVKDDSFGWEPEMAERLSRLIRAERIALLCIYHKSNTVLYRDDIATVRLKKRIPPDVFVNGSREREPYALEGFLEIVPGKDKTLLQLAALLRAVDATDINRARVGDQNEREAKQAGLVADLSYQFFHLKGLVEAMADQASLQGPMRARFVHLFYDLIVHNVKQLQFVTGETRAAQDAFAITNAPQLNLDRYFVLVDFIEFISVQEGHFDLHSSLDSTQVVHDPRDPRRFTLVYRSNQKRRWLADYCIREKGDAEALSLLERLCGRGREGGKEPRQSYVLKDFLEAARPATGDDGSDGLSHWLQADSVRVAVLTADGHLAGDSRAGTLPGYVTESLSETLRNSGWTGPGTTF